MSTEKIDPVQAALARTAAGKAAAKPATAAAPKAAAAQPTPAAKPEPAPQSTPEPAEKPADAAKSDVKEATPKLREQEDAIVEGAVKFDQALNNLGPGYVALVDDKSQGEVLTDTVKLQPPTAEEQVILNDPEFGGTLGDLREVKAPEFLTSPVDPEPVEVNEGKPANADGDYSQGLPPPRNLPYFSF